MQWKTVRVVTHCSSVCFRFLSSFRGSILHCFCLSALNFNCLLFQSLQWYMNKSLSVFSQDQHHRIPRQTLFSLNPQHITFSGCSLCATHIRCVNTVDLAQALPPCGWSSVIFHPICSSPSGWSSVISLIQYILYYGACSVSSPTGMLKFWH